MTNGPRLSIGRGHRMPPIVRSSSMKPISVGLRRRLARAFAVSAAGGVAVTLFLGPTPTAGTDPCAASEVARTVGGVATNTGSYLDAHPQTNQALTTISQQ